MVGESFLAKASLAPQTLDIKGKDVTQLHRTCVYG